MCRFWFVPRAPLPLSELTWLQPCPQDPSLAHEKATLTLCTAPTFSCSAQGSAWVDVRGSDGCTGQISLWDAYEGSTQQQQTTLAPLRQHPSVLSTTQPLQPGGQNVFKFQVGDIGTVQGIVIGQAGGKCNWHLDTALLTLATGAIVITR